MDEDKGMRCFLNAASHLAAILEMRDGWQGGVSGSCVVWGFNGGGGRGGGTSAARRRDGRQEGWAKSIRGRVSKFDCIGCCATMTPPFRMPYLLRGKTWFDQRRFYGFESTLGAMEASSQVPPRLMIAQMELENFKSYAGVRTIGPFHKVLFSGVLG